MSRRPEVVNVRASQIESKVRSKKDLYDLFKDHCKCANLRLDQFFMPNYLYCPIKFLKEIWTGDKAVSLTLINLVFKGRRCFEIQCAKV